MQFYCEECEHHMEILKWSDYPECTKCGEYVTCSNAKDVVFDIEYPSDGDDEAWIWITDKWYYEKHGCFDDCYRGGPWLDALNNKGPNDTGVFENAAEAMFEYIVGKDNYDQANIEDAIVILEAAGCTRVVDPDVRNPE